MSAPRKRFVVRIGTCPFDSSKRVIAPNSDRVPTPVRSIR
jgi:hypothetical protein